MFDGYLMREKSITFDDTYIHSVLSSLEREASERSDARAQGLATFIKIYKFVASVYIRSDLLPHLASLRKAFQKKNLNFSAVKPLVQGIKAVVAAQEHSPSLHFQSIPVAMVKLSENGFEHYNEDKMRKFKRGV